MSLISWSPPNQCSQDVFSNKTVKYRSGLACWLIKRRHVPSGQITVRFSFVALRNLVDFCRSTFLYSSCINGYLVSDSDENRMNVYHACTVTWLNTSQNVGILAELAALCGEHTYETFE